MTGLNSTMAQQIGFSWRRRAFLQGAAAVTAIAALGLAPAFAGKRNAEDQAEWPQQWQVSDELAVGRETTPTLSAATVAATENAIAKYQELVTRGGWNAVPGGAELRLGAKGRGVQALRQRLAISGDLDADAGMGPTFDSFVEAGVKRFQIRHGLGPTGVVDGDTLKA